MSQKNFASYGDMETIVTEIASKCGPYTEIAYEDWLQLTPYQQEHGRWDVTGVPGADGTVSIDLMTKLWENPSPTSAFAAQSIAVGDISGYSMIGIKHNLGFVIIGSLGTYITQNVPASGNKLAVYRRKAEISGQNVVFGDCILTQSDNTVTTGNNTFIPHQIYGIKLHHTVEIKAIAPTVSTLAEKCMMSDGETSVEDELNTIIPRTATGTTLSQLVTAIGKLSEEQKDRCIIIVNNTYHLRRSLFAVYNAVFVGSNGIFELQLQASSNNPHFYNFNHAYGTSTRTSTEMSVTSWTIYYQGTPIS